MERHGVRPEVLGKGAVDHLERESRNDVGMNLGATVIGALLIVVGVIWFLQGVGVLGQSGQGMTGDSTWALIGPLVAGAGIALVAWSRRRPS